MGKGRAPCCAKVGLNKGSWMPEEDMRLIAYINQYGHGNWRALPRLAGLARCGKSCRLRWINYLRPDIKRGNFSKEEEDTIIKLHGLLGNKWSKIASCLPGRTDNEIKNVWNTHLKKKIAGKVQNSNNWSELQKHEETPSSSSSVTSASVSCSEGESKTGKGFEEGNKIQDFSSVLELPPSTYDVGQKCEDLLMDIPEILMEPSEVWNMISEDDAKANENQDGQGWNDENWMAYIERELESIREEELDIANIVKGEDPVASYFQGLHSSSFHMI